MGRTVVVEVTAGDIADGAPRKCESCPIAIATKRATGEGFVSAAPKRLRFSKNNEERVAATPTAAAEFMRNFDEGNPVKPFTFTVELP